jgi:hypothetical protein
MSVKPTGTPLDCVTRVLIEHGVPLTQRNWITFAYLGAKCSIDELDAEELADLPEGLEDWPEDAGHVIESITCLKLSRVDISGSRPGCLNQVGSTLRTQRKPKRNGLI